MSAGIYNIEIDQGSDFETNLTVDGTSLDGYSARGQIRATIRSAAVLGEFDFTITGATSTGGTIEMSLPNYISRDMPAGIHVYDVEIYNDTTRKALRLLKGTCTIVQGVTK